MAKTHLVGLDIGSRNIKVCQLKDMRRGYQLQSFGMIPVPPESIVDGTVVNSTAVADAIKELLSSQKIKQKQVALAISGNAVILRKLSMPVMSQELLEESIRREGEQYLPFDINDVYLDVSILREQNEQGQMDVLLVAAKKDVVNDYVNVVAEAGFQAVVVDIASFALQNAYELNYGFVNGETIVLVNVGGAVTNINIVVDSTSAFTRDIALGGLQYNDEIQKQLSVTQEESEALKVGGFKR